jgi:hypothetical protein
MRFKIINKEILSCIILCMIISYFSGCTRTVELLVSQDKILTENIIKIKYVILLDGKCVIFNNNGGFLIKKNKENNPCWIIAGKDIFNNNVEFELKNVLESGIEKIEYNVLSAIAIELFGFPSAIIIIILFIWLFSGHQGVGG